LTAIMPDLEDTHGVTVDRFELQWDTGSPWNPLNVDSEIFSTLAGMFWVWYRDMVSVQIWVLDWVLGMDWLSYILAPLAGLSVIVKGMVAQIGLLNLMLVILAFVVGFWLIKGRYAGGFVELLIGCVLAALATGYLADPMLVVGGDDGVIVQSRDAGMDIATGFATDGASFEQDANVIRDGLKGQLVNTLVRTPHQIINYGAVIDTTRCEGTYTENVGRDNAAEAMAACNDAYGEAASTVDAGTVVSTLSLLTTGFVFLLLSVVIVGGTIFAVLLLGWSAIKLLWQLPIGVVSSGTRAQLFRTFASVAFGMVLVAMATMFLVAWMKILLGFYDATSGLPFLVRLYLFNTLVIAGAVFYVLMGASIRQAFRTMADKLAAAGVPSQVGEPVAMPWANHAQWTERANKVKAWAGAGLGPAPVQPNKNNVTIKDETGPVQTSPAVTPETSNPAGGQTMTEEIRMPDQPEQSAAERLGQRLSDGARTAAGTAARVAATAVPGGPAVTAAVDGSRVLREGIEAMRQGNPAPAPDQSAGQWTAAASTARRTTTATASTGIPAPYKESRPHVPATADSSIQVARKSALRAALRAAGRRAQP
jgi:hypothetical protein